MSYTHPYNILVHTLPICVCWLAHCVIIELLLYGCGANITSTKNTTFTISPNKVQNLLQFNGIESDRSDGKEGERAERAERAVLPMGAMCVPKSFHVTRNLSFSVRLHKMFIWRYLVSDIISMGMSSHNGIRNSGSIRLN